MVFILLLLMSTGRKNLSFVLSLSNRNILMVTSLVFPKTRHWIARTSQNTLSIERNNYHVK